MRKSFFLPRFLALFLALSLALPSPAFALRNEQAVNAGMEEKLTQALGHTAAGIEEVLQSAKEKVARVRTLYSAGTLSFRDASSELSGIAIGFLKAAQQQAEEEILNSGVLVVNLHYSIGPSHAVTVLPKDLKLAPGDQVIQFARDSENNRQVFTVVGGSVGRGSEAVFQPNHEGIGSDLEFIVMPSNKESVAYAEALFHRTREILSDLFGKNTVLGFEVDRILVDVYNPQVPPELVPERFLGPTVKIFEIDEFGPRESETSSAEISTFFRDMRFVSGDQAAFDKLQTAIRSRLYPADPEADPLVNELVSRLRDLSWKMKQSGLDRGVDVKDPVTMIRYFVWIARASTQIDTSDGFDAIKKMEQLGWLSPKEATQLSDAYDFFLRTRVALLAVQGTTLTSLTKEAKDRRRIFTKEMLPQVVPFMRPEMKAEEFEKAWSRHLGNVLWIVGNKILAPKEPGSIMDPETRALFATAWSAWNPKRPLMEQPEEFRFARTALEWGGYRVVAVRRLGPGEGGGLPGLNLAVHPESDDLQLAGFLASLLQTKNFRIKGLEPLLENVEQHVPEGRALVWYGPDEWVVMDRGPGIPLDAGGKPNLAGAIEGGQSLAASVAGSTKGTGGWGLTNAVTSPGSKAELWSNGFWIATEGEEASPVRNLLGQKAQVQGTLVYLRQFAAGAEEVVPVIRLSDYNILVPYSSASEAIVYKHKSRSEVLKEFIVPGTEERHLRRYVMEVNRLGLELNNAETEIVPAELVKTAEGKLLVRTPFVAGISLGALYGKHGPLADVSPIFLSDSDKEYVRLLRVAHRLLERIGPLADVHVDRWGRSDPEGSLENFWVPERFLRDGNLSPEEYGKIQLVNIDPLSMPRIQEQMARGAIEALMPSQLTPAQGFLLGLARKYELFPMLERALLEQHGDVLPRDAQTIFRQLGSILATGRVGAKNQNVLEFEIRGDLLVAREMDRYGEVALREMSVPLPASLKQETSNPDTSRLLDVFLQAAGAEEELNPEVRSALLEFQDEEDSRHRLSVLEGRLRSFQPVQRVQFLNALPWLPDQGKVSHLIVTAFTTQNQPLAEQLLTTLEDALRDETKRNLLLFDQLLALRLLLMQMPFENARKVREGLKGILTNPGQKKFADRWAEITAEVVTVAHMAPADSAIRGYRTEVFGWRLQPERPIPSDSHAELYLRMGGNHEQLSYLYRSFIGRLSRGDQGALTERVKEENAFEIIQKAVGQMLSNKGLSPDLRRLIGQGMPETVYEWAQNALRSRIQNSLDPLVQRKDLERLIELEESFGDYLKVQRDPEAGLHYAEAFRLQARLTNLIQQRQRALGLSPAAGAEEITTLDQLLERFPRLDRSRDRYLELFSLDNQISKGITIPEAARLLQRVETLERAVQEKVPGLRAPLFARINLESSSTLPYVAAVNSDPANKQHVLNLNLLHWRSLTDFTLLHEMGEAILAEHWSPWQNSITADQTESLFIHQGLPGHPWVQVLPLPADHPQRRGVLELWAALGVFRMGDVVADAIAFLLGAGRPDVMEGFLRQYDQIFEDIQRQADSNWEMPKEVPAKERSKVLRGIMVGNLANLARLQGVLQAHGDTDRAARSQKLAGRVLTALQGVSAETFWGDAYQTVVSDDQSIAHNLRLRQSAAGAEELEGLIDWVTDGIQQRRKQAGDEIDRAAIRPWVSNIVQWLSRLLGADVVEKVWFNPSDPAIRDRLVPAIDDIGLLSMNTRFMPRIEQAFMGVEQEGPLSQWFFRGVFQLDPVMFSQIIDRVDYSHDEPWKWEEIILDTIGEAPGLMKPALEQLFRVLQQPLLRQITPPDPLDRARTLAAVLPRRVSELAQALQADPSPAAQFWSQRINPLVWQDASRVQELLVWMTEHEFPVPQDMLDDLLVAFRERTPAQPLGRSTYPGFGLPEVVAGLQILLEKPELREPIGRLLLFRDETGKSYPNVVGRLGGLGSFDRIRGENPYGNVLFFARLPSDFPDRPYGSFKVFLNAVVAEMRSFYGQHSDEGIPPAAGAEERLGRAERVWKDIAVAPSYEGVTKRMLPVFYAGKTFSALPIAAKAGPVLIIATSQSGMEEARGLLQRLAIPSDHYRIWMVDGAAQLQSALARAEQELSGQFHVYPVNPERAGWLKELLAGLEEQGNLPVGDLGPAIEATQDYFRFV